MEYNNIISVKITDDQLKILKEIEKEMCINRSSIIRLALQEFLNKINNNKNRGEIC